MGQMGGADAQGVGGALQGDLFIGVFGNIGNEVGVDELEVLFATMINAIDEALDSFATLLLSITSTIILLELIINAFKVKNLRKAVL